MVFEDAPAVNIHGLHVTMGAYPANEGENMRGRWYVVMLPRSVAENSTTRAEWISQLDSRATTNNALEGSSFVWGSGVFVATNISPWQHTFSPKTSRNAQNESRLMVLIVADSISGAIDFWETTSNISCFTSS